MDDKFRETRVKFQEICRKILLDIVTTHIENERPKYASFWNHKTFLHYIRNREGMKMMLPHHKEILYPKDGEPALVSEWDLSLLTFIMLIPCRRNANEEALDIINKLKVMRDSILENKETQVEILEHLIAHAPQTLKAKMLQIIERDFSLIAREEPQQDILKNWQTNDMKINLQGLSQGKCLLDSEKKKNPTFLFLTIFLIFFILIMFWNIFNDWFRYIRSYAILLKT